MNAPALSPTPAPAAPASLAGMTRSELAAALAEAGVAAKDLRMRTAQVWHWIYHRGATDFSQMKNVAKPMQTLLAERHTLARPEIVAEQVSADGTRKWLMRMAPAHRFDKGAEIECVYIPENDRGTLCVSAQVGCTLNCTFCHTGTQKLVRNLTAAEIVAQVMVARDRLGDFPGGIAPTDGLVPSGEGVRAVSNIVFMGMGEPLYNFDNVRDAIGVLTDGDGLVAVEAPHHRLDLGRRAGDGELGRANAARCSPFRCMRRTTRCATSSCRSTRNIRSSDLLDACRDLSRRLERAAHHVRICDAEGRSTTRPPRRSALVRLLKGMPAKINLIPFNPWPGTPYECSDWETIENFSDIVFNAGYASPVRTPRGRDILAACGQLKSETEKLRARARLMLEESLAAGQE